MIINTSEFLSVCEDYSSQALKLLNKKSSSQRQVLHHDDDEYKYELMFTSLRSILTPFVFLTKWISKSSIDIIHHDVCFLVEFLIQSYENGCLVQDLKLLGVVCLNPLKIREPANWTLLTKMFRGGLLKTLKLMAFNINSQRQSRNHCAYRFFYSMNQAKCGITSIPNQDIYNNMLNWKKAISTKDDQKIENRAEFALEFATHLIYQDHDFDYTIVKPKLPMGATFTHKRGELAFVEREIIDQLTSDGPLHKVEADIVFKDRLLRHYQKIPRNNKAKLVILTEPLKLRTLTIADVNYQFGCRDFQKYLINGWKSSPYSTMHDNAIENYMNCDSQYLEGEISHSVDYTAATDKIKSKATKMVLKELFEMNQVDPEFRSYILSAVSGRDLNFFDLKFLNERCLGVGKSLKKKHSGEFKQATGQMMGNPLSFALLCVINLSTFLRADLEGTPFFEEAYKLWKLTKKCSNDVRALNGFWNRPQGQSKFFNWKETIRTYRGLLKSKPEFNEYMRLLVNGDDALKKRMYEVNVEKQQKFAGDVGLVVNPSKSIKMRNLANINSRQFFLKNGVWIEVGHLNQRLLYDFNIKSMVNVEVSGEDNVCSRLTKFIDQTCGGNIAQLAQCFIDTNKSIDKSVEISLSSNIGGGGVIHASCEDAKGRISRDRLLWVWNQYNNTLFQRRKILSKKNKIKVLPHVYGGLQTGQWTVMLLWPEYVAREKLIDVICRIKIIQSILLGVAHISACQLGNSYSYSEVYSNVYASMSKEFLLSDIVKQRYCLDCMLQDIKYIDEQLSIPENYKKLNINYSSLSKLNKNGFFSSDNCGIHLNVNSKEHFETLSNYQLGIELFGSDISYST
jgi:hypothetical protein